MSVQPPPCKRWGLWKGKEIEGDKDLGVLTLFVRRAELQAILDALSEDPTITRVWFCHEFREYKAMQTLFRQFKKHTFCVEVTEKSSERLPRWVWDKLTVYYKLRVSLKAGDFVSVGEAYADETFRLGTGAKVLPDQYLPDVCLDKEIYEAPYV